MKTVITTVGTSFFDNLGIKKGYKNDPFCKEEWERDVIHDFHFKDSVTTAKENGKESSAEIASLIIYQKKENIKLNVVLICTDTITSRIAAECIILFFKDNDNFDFTTLPIVIKGLQVDNADEFENIGFPSLMNEVKKIKNDNKENDVILNISGGFKALIPPLTIVGQLYDIKLIYRYEKSDEILSIGNLPVNYDWQVIETLKPFIKSYYLKENQELNAIAKLFFSNTLSCNNKGKFESTDPDISNKLNKISIQYHHLFHALFSYNLIKEKEGGIEPSIIANIIDNSDNNYNGYIMEHLLFKYFLSNKKNKIVQNYTTLPFGININHSRFTVTDQQVRLSNNGEGKKIGDIDVPLELSKNGQKYYVWGESKAFSAACSYSKKIGKDKDYLYQFKARALAMIEANKLPGEIFFIVFKFVFKGLNDKESLLSDHLKIVLSNLQQLNEDTKIKGKVHFKCLSLKIPLEFNNGKVNFTNLYKTENFSDWQWEELAI